MRKLVLSALALLLLTSLAGSVYAANWYLLGKTGYTETAAIQNDFNRIRYGDVVADSAGNVYASQSAQIGGISRGVVTIFRTDGTKSSVELGSAAANDMGRITKLVRGNDGNVYAGMNWNEVNYNLTNQREAIVRINSNGTATEIWSPGSFLENRDIVGLTVSGDGVLYWTMNGADSYWKNHFLLRYNPSTGVPEEAPQNAAGATGWGQDHTYTDVTWAGQQDGEDWFLVVHRNGVTWEGSAMSWNNFRRGAVNGNSNPGWGRKQPLDLLYDPSRNQVYGLARGDNNRCIATRWNGDDLSCLFDPEAIADPMPGIASSSVWHLVGDFDNGAQFWQSAGDIDPATGQLWSAVKSADPTKTMNGWQDNVFRVDPDTLAAVDEGVPELGADVNGLGFANGGTYALVWNRTTGEYSVYSTLIPEPGSLLALGTGLIGLVGLIRRRK